MLRIDKLKIPNVPTLSFSIADGTCWSIEGPSGSGKTRILRAIADLEPSSGQIFLNGIERNEIPGFDWRRQVRYVSAEPGWWTPTARQAIPKNCTEAVERLCSRLGLDPELLDRDIDVVSTGERHRLALALALSDDPPVLLLDEPTGNLDAGNTALIEEQIRYLRISDRIIVLVSHDKAQIERLADQRLQLAPDVKKANADAPEPTTLPAPTIEKVGRP
ncbi:MAG: ATP-binding cassette domain-containing protein [Pseudomonadota bacterium]